MNRIKYCLAWGLFILLPLVSCDDNKSVEIVPNINLEKTEITLSAYAQSVDINLSSNVDFDVESDADWLSASKYYDADTSTITISVLEYEGVDNERTGIVNIIPSVSSEKLSIKVIQSAMGMVDVVDNVYNVTSNKQTLSISVKHNYDYEVIIPDEAKTWIELAGSNDTKAVVESMLTLSISENEDYTPRKAQLVISIPSYNEMDTIRIIQEEGFESLRKIIRANNDCSLFYEALRATGLEDTLINYLDTNYPTIDYEWTRQALEDGYSGIHLYETAYETGDRADRVVYPEQRLFKYTVFLVTDSILYNYSDNYWNGGIHNLDELRAYARNVYNNPEYLELPDTSRNSPLNKLISYHILPCWLSYDQFNTSQIDLIKQRLFLSELDVEDFYATLQPHSIMRISSAYSTDSYDSRIGIFINRKGTIKTGIDAEGILIDRDALEKVLSSNLFNTCLNGGYHYVNRILVYDDETRFHALQCRMRIMGSTLSPDFINSGARGRFNGDPSNKGNRNIDQMSYTFKSGFCKNVYWSEGTDLYVRYRDKTFGSYYGDEISISGDFDIVFKLPSVAFDASYEFRHMFFALFDRSVVQYYIYEGNEKENPYDWQSWNWEQCGEPVDLSLNADSIGMISDDDEKYDDMPERDKSEAIYQDDLEMRSRGYMKAPDSYGTIGNSLRADQNCLRKIICRLYLSAEKNYYLRIKKVDEQPNSVCPINFIEIVPKDIYDGPVPEDNH